MGNWTERFALTGKTALVTGATKGIGIETCKVLADAGADIAAVGRDPAGLQEIKAAVEAQGRRCVAIAADMATVEGPARAAEEALGAFGTVDILVNNAAIRPLSKISEITVEQWDLVHATNLRAPFFLSQAVLPAMVRKKWGRIINIGGLDAYWGKPRRAHNVSAKLGLTGLTRALANEVARFGVTVNIVVPGTTDTVRPHPEWYPGLDKIYDERRERIPMERLG